MEAADAFICLANLLNRSSYLAFFRVDHTLMRPYFDSFNIFLHESMPKLSAHFEQMEFSPEYYLIEWLVCWSSLVMTILKVLMHTAHSLTHMHTYTCVRTCTHTHTHTHHLTHSYAHIHTHPHTHTHTHMHMDRIFTIYTRTLPLDIACRVWDMFCRDGDSFLFRTALGMYGYYMNKV